MKTRETGMITESDFWKFVKAQAAAEEAGTKTFTCPVCGSEAHWDRNDYNKHIRAWCSGCQTRIMA